MVLFDEVCMFEMIHMSFNFLKRKRCSLSVITEKKQLHIFQNGIAKFLGPLDLYFVMDYGLLNCLSEGELR